MMLARYREAIGQCAEAIEVARAVEDLAAEGHATNTLGCALAYSGQSEEGYNAFRLRPQLEYVGGWDECGIGDTPVFSPGSQYLAHILITSQGFLSPSGEPDSEFEFFEVPATRPLVFEYADLRVHELPDGGIKRHPLRVHLPADFDRFLADQNTSAEEWLGESFMTQLEFVADDVLRIQCTKLAKPVDVKLPITGPVVFDLSGL